MTAGNASGINDGAAALIIGNRGDGESFPWGYFKMWLLDTNVGRFEKIS